VGALTSGPPRHLRRSRLPLRTRDATDTGTSVHSTELPRQRLMAENAADMGGLVFWNVVLLGSTKEMSYGCDSSR